MFNFLHTFQPTSVLLQIPFLTIHWYGLFIVLGVSLALLALLYLAKQYGFKRDKILDLAFYVIIFGLIGDRLYYVLYAWDYYSRNLLDIFKVWEGGLAIHGAIIAGAVVTYVYARKHRLNTWFLLDMIVVGVALAMAVGRFGNYFNMELFGKPTTLPWGIPILPEKRPVEYLSEPYFHPTFLYESIWDFCLFIGLMTYHKIRLGLNKNNLEKIQGYGHVFVAFLFFYSLGRFLNEFLRIDYSPYVFGFRWAQIMSVLLMFSCLTFLIRKIIIKLKSAR